MSEYINEPLPESASTIEVVEPSSTQEVVQNVQEILTTEPAVQEVSTEIVDNSNVNELEERVRVLEERLMRMHQWLTANFPSWKFFEQRNDI